MLISIIIPVYNRIKYIEATVNSAINQTYSNIEIVIVDNSSTDGTWEKLQSIMLKDKRIKIFQQESNVGAVENWKTALRLAKGQVIKILWSDDLIEKDFLEKTLPLLGENVAFVFTDVSFDQASSRSFILKKTGLYDGELFLRYRSVGKSLPVSPGCAIFWATKLKNNFIDNIPNSVNLDLKQKAIGTDLLFYLLSIGENEKFGYVDEKLSYFRTHSDSITIAEGRDIGLLYHFSDILAFDKINNRKYIQNLKTLIFLKLMKNSNNKYKIKIQDYYPNFKKIEINFSLFVEIIIEKIVERGIFGTRKIIKQCCRLAKWINKKINTSRS